MNNRNHPGQHHINHDLQDSYEGASFLHDYQVEDEIPEDFVDHISSIEERVDPSRLAEDKRSALAGARLLDDQVGDYTEDIETQIDALHVDSVPQSYQLGTSGNEPNHIDKLDYGHDNHRVELDNDYQDLN